MESKVSVVIPFYNCPYIDQAIESVLNQTYKNVEIIVVNDGSTVHKEKIEPYLGRIRFYGKGNGGTASALNAGFRLATGDYITWLSSDDLMKESRISRQLVFMKETNSKISYCDYSLINEQGEVTVANAGLHYSDPQVFYERMKYGNHINGCTVMMKKEVFDSVGLFNEQKKYTQDYDYWLRVMEKYSFIYLNDPLVSYRVHRNMGSKIHSAQQLAEINMIKEQYGDKLELLKRKQKKQLRLTFPILTLCKGGAQRMLAEIANGLVRKGHEVIILMPPQGVVEYEVAAKIIRSKEAVLSASDYPESDYIISNFHTTVDSAQKASEAKKGIHIRFSLCYEPMFLPEQHLSFQTYHQTKHLVVLSQYQQKLIELNHGIKGHIIPIGVSPGFTNLHLRGNNEKLNISSIVRLPEGGFSWQRGQDYLIEVLRRIKLDYPKVSINLICPPNEFKASSQLKALAESGEFRFVTPESDASLIRYYNEADIFVTSSVFEAAPLPGLEAMKCGAALAAVYAGGNTEYCKDGINCLLSYRYENNLYHDLARLINDTDLRTRLALQGELDSAAWTWSRSVDEFEKIIYSIN
ncbi:glycosyltransferase [Bacillus infantis]|jgi:glycosyltransferase involved in cell wall biosynthesis|uniref:glycosyltransferase n=1 Tax=Bacillus infantis TaxID=324767 RepID=UPI003CED6B05